MAMINRCSTILNPTKEIGRAVINMYHNPIKRNGTNVAIATKLISVQAVCEHGYIQQFVHISCAFPYTYPPPLPHPHPHPHTHTHMHTGGPNNGDTSLSSTGPPTPVCINSSQWVHPYKVQYTSTYKQWGHTLVFYHAGIPQWHAQMTGIHPHLPQGTLHQLT